MSDRLRVVPLGGTGEIGKNMYLVEFDGQILIIDCGVTFPSRDQLGVDLVIPDFAYVEERVDDIVGLVLTHGHEDHIGAVPYLVRAIGRLTVYSARFTLGLLRSKLDEHRLLSDVEMVEVSPAAPAQIGPFDVQFFPLTHSIPDCLAVALRTPAGTVLHTGDFKFDHQPVAGPRADIPGLSRLGDAGVDILLADSTNAERSGAIRPERTVGDEMRRVFALAPGRVIITVFSSHIHRVQQVLNAAYEDARVVCLIGRSLLRNGNIAMGLGYLTPRDGVLVKHTELRAYPLDEQIIICTGSQGEALSALSRMSRGEHHQINIEPTDTVVYSSRVVPGNELAVNDVINRIVKIGARVITEESDPGVHVSGHGSAADLLLMLQLVRPKIFAPIHGEARHQRAHANLAISSGVAPEDIFILENGDVLEYDGEGARLGERVEAGLTYVDGMGVGDVAEGVLRDRRHLAEDGLVMVIATVGARDGVLLGEVDIVARGVGFADDERLIEETRIEAEKVLAHASASSVDVNVLQHTLHDAVAALLHRRTRQRPMVLPVIVEV